MYRKVLVPLDGSELAECVLPHMEALAKGGSVQNVIFVRVVEPYALSPVRGDPIFTEEELNRIDSQSKKVAKSYLDQLVSRISYGNSVKIQTEVLTGRTADTLIDYASKNQVDLIIIATHGRSGISRWLLGSVADRIVRSSHIPVLMVRAC